MARVDYAEPAGGGPELQELIERIKGERGGRLLNLYRMLLNSPAVAAGWLHLGTAVRYQTELDGHSRELAICMVARLTGSDYEWQHHQPLAHREGIGAEQLAALPGWRVSDLFDRKQQAVLAYAEQMTQQIEVDDEAFAALEDHFDRQKIVELTSVIAFYNLVARFLAALRIDID